MKSIQVSVLCNQYNTIIHEILRQFGRLFYNEGYVNIRSLLPYLCLAEVPLFPRLAQLRSPGCHLASKCKAQIASLLFCTKTLLPLKD